MKKILTIVTAIIMAIVLSGCFSAWQEKEGTIKINLGGTNARFVPGADEQAAMEYTITLTNESGAVLTRGPFTGSSAVFNVSPGNWDVEVRAVGKTPDQYQGYASDGNTSGAAIFPDRMLRGMSEPRDPVPVAAGQTVQADIQMITATEVSNSAQIERAVELAGSQEEIIVIKNDILLDDTIRVYTNNDSIKHLTIIADGNVQLSRNTSTSTATNSGYFTDELFYVGDGNTLILGKPGMKGTLTLTGNNRDVTGPIVKVVGGDFTMNDGVTLANNRYTDNGGGVFVCESGTFTMNGGVISGNTAYQGGGVYINGGTFTMNGGIIYGENGGNNSNRATASPDVTGTTLATGHAIYAVSYDENENAIIKYQNDTVSEETLTFKDGGETVGKWDSDEGGG